jgi:hypothetical protein
MNQTISDVSTWRDAVFVLVDLKTRAGECFSSGEFAKYIRENRPDIVFSVYDIGQHLRDLYFSHCIAFNGAQAFQIPRKTTGSGRTPAGVEVFVYSPTFDAGAQHDFEVDIPLPNKALGDASQYSEYGTMQHEAELRKDSQDDPVATVHKDGRLCIPRKAFDTLMHATGRAVQPGDKVHIKLDQSSQQVIVSLDDCSDAKSYDLTRDRGRVKYLPDNLQSWASGDRYEISVNQDKLVVDFSKAL